MSKPARGETITVNARRYHNRMRGYEAARAEADVLRDQLAEARDALAFAESARDQALALARHEQNERAVAEAARNAAVAAYRRASDTWQRDEAQYGHRIDALHRAMHATRREAYREGMVEAFDQARHIVGQHFFTRAPGRKLVERMTYWRSRLEEIEAQRRTDDVKAMGT